MIEVGIIKDSILSVVSNDNLFMPILQYVQSQEFKTYVFKFEQRVKIENKNLIIKSHDKKS